jgi:U4/U6.U5 tri-snRNP-associated protein 2
MNPYVIPDPSKHEPSEPIMYDLVANVIHEAVKVRDDSVSGETQKKIWKVQLKDKARDAWYEVEDLYMRSIQGQTLFTSEAYIMIWEKRVAPATTGKGKARAA